MKHTKRGKTPYFIEEFSVQQRKTENGTKVLHKTFLIDLNSKKNIVKEVIRKKKQEKPMVSQI